MRRLLVPLVALALALTATAAHAGAWTLRRGETQTFVASTFTYGDHGFDEDGELVTVPEYRKFGLSAALEYGLRPWVTAIVRGELLEESIEQEVSETLIAPVSQNFASVAGGARVRLFRGPTWVVSTEVTAFSGGFTTAGAGKPSDGPALEVRVLGGYGTTVFGRNAYLDGQVAYRTRFDEGEADEVRVDLTAGVEVLPNWALLGQTFSTFELGGEGEESQYHKVSASVVRTVTDRLRVEVGGVATVAGRNALQEFGGRIGFWWTLPPGSTREDEATDPDFDYAAMQSVLK